MWHLLFPLALSPGAGPAAQPASPPAWLAELAERVDVYGRFDGYLAFSKEDVDVANNTSRFGIQAEQSIFADFSLIGHAEWRVNLGQGDTTYAVSENPDTQLATVESSTQPAIATRLGFVGVRFGRYGALTLGKQWGVYYDVSEWTDRFTVFGANGSSTYNAGTDGGQTGEGRANDALAYRVPLGPLRLGVQAQFVDSRSNVVDSLSGSLVWKVLEGLRIGAAYSRAFLDFGTNIVGYDGGDAQAFTVGATFDGGDWIVSSVNTWTRNHEGVATDAATVAYDTLGAELYVARKIRGVAMPYAGFDFAIPRQLDTTFVDPDYGTRDFLAGFRWLFDPKAISYAYLEARTGRTRDAAGARAEDVVTLGLRFNYSLRRALGLEKL